MPSGSHRRINIPIEKLAQAERWRAASPPMKWRVIAASLGCSLHALRRSIDPKYRERRQVQTRETKRRRPVVLADARLRSDGLDDKRYGRYKRVEGSPIEDSELRQRLRAIPADTRDLTAQIMGDPLPGRRALDDHEKRTACKSPLSRTKNPSPMVGMVTDGGANMGILSRLSTGSD